MYEKYLRYVKEYLAANDGEVPQDPLMAFRSKYHHTLRVFGWAKKLAEGRDDIDQETLYTAAIFHDIGNTIDKKDHAQRGAKAFNEYGLRNNMNIDFVEKVTSMIALHSSKELLKEKDTPLELILLMEADLLDEEGALRMVWYTLDKGIRGASSYEDVYDHIVMGNNKRLVNPMVTEKAKHLWNEKHKLVELFTQELENDIKFEL